MENFRIKLAGVVFDVSAEFPETEAYCKDFFTDEQPEIGIVLTERDRERARKTHMETDVHEGRTPDNYAETLLESTALQLRVLDELISHGSVLFHGSAVAVNGGTYLFCADSGTGKTTHSELWLKNFPQSHILNGDKPILTYKNGTVYACGTPWRGKEHCGTNEILPLRAICLLERDTENHMEAIPFKDALAQLIRHSHCPGDAKDMLRYMKFMQKLADVPIYRLGCNMTDDAALVAYNAMVEE